MARRSAATRATSLRFLALGGLGEVGMNCAAYECNGKILVVDCGVTFPEGDHFGIDVIVPDFTWLVERQEQVAGVILTHGHADHIGALPYLLREIDVPVWAPRFAAGLVRSALEEHGLHRETELNIVSDGDRVRVGGFDVEFLHVNHSIPDAFALALRTAAGLFLHTADFKFDRNPVDEPPADLGRFAELGREGVRALFSDSTNIEVPGVSGSERDVRGEIDEAVREAPGRVIATLFATNVTRVQSFVDAAFRSERRICLLGRSLQRAVSIARDSERLRIPGDSMFVSPDAAADLPPDEVLLLCTGSQGEPRAAMSRLANNDYRPLRVEPGDTVIFSSRVIPGNERLVARLADQLARRGARILDGRGGLHVSGHACREEQTLMIQLTRPAELVPIHGDYRFLRAHAELGEALGVPATHLIDSGDVLEIGPNGSRVVDRVQTRRIVVAGGMLEDLEGDALRDRRRIARQGLCVVWVVVDSATGQLIEGPELRNFGAIAADAVGEGIMNAARDAAVGAFDELAISARMQRPEVAEAVRAAVQRVFRQQTQRKTVVEAIVSLA